MVTQTLKLRPRSDDDTLTTIGLPILKELAQRARSLRLYAKTLELQIRRCLKRYVARQTFRILEKGLDET